MQARHCFREGCFYICPKYTIIKKVAKENKKQLEEQESKIWWWIVVFLLLLGLISGGSLIYLANQPSSPPPQLNQQEKEQYQLQQKHLISLNSLENNPKVKEFLADLLKKYSEKFAQDKKIDVSSLPLHLKDFI